MTQENIHKKHAWYKPFMLPVAEAHHQKTVTFDEKGNLYLRHPQYNNLGIPSEVVFHTRQQFSTVFSTFMDLNKSLSRLANSPLLEEGLDLRQKFDNTFSTYRSLLDKIDGTSSWEPDFGNYLFDLHANTVYVIAPEFWHRIGLVTNTSKLLTDPEGKLSWWHIREKLNSSVIGFAGISVGGNVLEGWMREGRPKRVKVADPDWMEITNLNRLERGSLRHLVKSRGEKQDPADHYELARVNKAELAAYEHSLIDPYSVWSIYSEGLNSDNMDRFFLGDGKEEPRIDIFVEEMDNFSLKYEVREKCRKYGIPVLMLSDFGHCVQMQFQDFKKDTSIPIGYKASDVQTHDVLKRAMKSGNREDIFEFMRVICGEDFAKDEFADWIAGIGEQPTSSLPQSGATAMTSGGIGGKLIAMHILGYKLPERCIFDLKRLTVSE